MNKKQITMLTSMVTVISIGSMLLFSGVLNQVNATPNISSDFASKSLQSGVGPGAATKIIVEIDSPFGFEVITSFKSFNTDNLMQEGGYHTLKLQGNIMNDKRTLLHWVAQDIGKMPLGLAADGITTHGATAVKMTKPKEGAKIDKVPLTGKVTLLLLEHNKDMFTTDPTRKLEFSGCHVAGYHVGTLHDNDKPNLASNSYEHYEAVEFACTAIKDLSASSMDSRGIIVERALGNDDRQIVNEKGELLTTLRDYRQPIVLGSHNDVEFKNVRKEILTRITLDNTNYKIGDVATFTVTFTDMEGNAIDPDKIRAVYDGKMIQLEKQDLGTYTFTTAPLTKTHHQLIVSVDKSGFPTDTTYLSIPIHRIS